MQARGGHALIQDCKHAVVQDFAKSCYYNLIQSDTPARFQDRVVSLERGRLSILPPSLPPIIFLSSDNLTRALIVIRSVRVRGRDERSEGYYFSPKEREEH